MVDQLSNEQIAKLTKALMAYDEDINIHGITNSQILDSPYLVGCKKELRKMMRSLGKNPTDAELENMIHEIVLTMPKPHNEERFGVATTRYIKNKWYGENSCIRHYIPKKTERSLQAAKKETEEGSGWGCKIM